MTTVQKERLYRRAYEHYISLYTGGGTQPFGYDWQTCRSVYPGWYWTLQSILAIVPSKEIK